LFDFDNEIFLRVIQDVTNDSGCVFFAMIFIFTKKQTDFSLGLAFSVEVKGLQLRVRVTNKLMATLILCSQKQLKYVRHFA